MRAINLVVATAYDNGIISLEGIDRNLIKIEGASIGELPGGDSYSNSLSFAIKQGESGMVAVVVDHRYGQGKSFGSCAYAFFLCVKWGEGEERPHVDLQKQWVPKDPARLGYFYYDKLEVVIDGFIYSSGLYAGGSDGKRRVKGSNLLCRYMDSKISAEQFREALGLPGKEQSVREELGEVKKHVTELQCSLESARRDYNRQLASKKAWEFAARQLKSAIKTHWLPQWVLHSEDIKKALDSFPAE